MDFLNPPSWINNMAKLQVIMDHQLHLPSDAADYITLEDKSLFLSGARQYLYWKGELAPSIPNNSVVFTFLGPQGLKQANVLNVLKSLKTLCDMSKTVEVFRGAHSAFLGISFSSSTEVDKIKSSFKFYEESIVAYVPQASANTFEYRLLWLPPMFEVEQVHHLLKAYTSSYDIRRESMRIDDVAFSPTNVVRGTLTPKENVLVKDLPHLIRLPTPHRGCALLIISGREPLCLKCREVGHQRSSCPLQKCTKCFKLHYASRPCGTTAYAVIAARNITKFDTVDWLEGVDDGSIPPSSTSLEDVTSSKPVTDFSKSPTSHTATELSSAELPMAEIAFSSSSPSGVDILGNSSTLDALSAPLEGICSMVSLECGSTLASSPDTSASVSIVSSLSSQAFKTHLTSRGQPSRKRATRSCSPLGQQAASSKSSRASEVPTADPLVTAVQLSSGRITTDSDSSCDVTEKVNKQSISKFDPHDAQLALRSSLITYEVHRHGFEKTTDPDGNGDIVLTPDTPSSINVTDDSFLMSESFSLGDGSGKDFTLLDESSAASRKRRSPSSEESESEGSLDSMETSMFHSSSLLTTVGVDADVDTLAGLVVPDSLLHPPFSGDAMDLIKRTGISVEMTERLAGICPDRVLDAESCKKIIVLHDYGIPPNHIFTRPRILTASLAVIKKRLKYLTKQYATTFSIVDVASFLPPRSGDESRTPYHAV